MKEKLKEIVNNKYFPVIFAVCTNVFFFIAINKLFVPQYEQIDDFMIMNLISKADGIYTVYGIQIHPLICAIIILLYKTSININWYTIFMLIMQFISFTIIGTVFIKKNKTIGMPLYVVFIFMIYSKMLSNIQYTTISILCITSGFILLMYSTEKIQEVNKFSLIISMIMITIGCMIRFSTIIIATPFFIIYFLCKIIKDRNFKILKIGLILMLLIVLVYISFNIFYNNNPIYKEFLKFHNARTYLHDYNILGYYKNKEIFDSVNWSGNDRDLFYGYLYGDEETYSPQIIEEIKEKSVQAKINNTDVLQKINYTINELIACIKKSLYKYIFLVTIMLVIINDLFIIIKNLKDKSEEKNDNVKLNFINYTFIAIIGMHCLFIILKRPMFRVVISIYIIGIAILIYELLQQIKVNKNKIINFACLILIFSVSILELKGNIVFGKKYSKDDYSVFTEIIEYTSSHKENAYLYSLAMHDRYLAYSIYEKIPDDTFSNIMALGDWDTYTENYYAFKERYDIDNLMKSLYKKDNVYLISANFIWREDIEMIEKYIKEHYNINIKANVIKEFKYDIKIYKLEEI